MNSESLRSRIIETYLEGHNCRKTAKILNCNNSYVGRIIKQEGISRSQYIRNKKVRVGNTKQCPSCKKMKKLSDFFIDQHCEDGKTVYCKVCKGKKARNYILKHRYGLTGDDWNKMFIKQQGCCAVCNKHQSELKQKLNIDHNHKNGKVRSLLCNRCNVVLGFVNDNVILLEKLINYLEAEENNAE